jgi:hypothetical protein
MTRFYKNTSEDLTKFQVKYRSLTRIFHAPEVLICPDGGISALLQQGIQEHRRSFLLQAHDNTAKECIRQRPKGALQSELSCRLQFAGWIRSKSKQKTSFLTEEACNA